jgi:hypothetical protein
MRIPLDIISWTVTLVIVPCAIYFRDVLSRRRAAKAKKKIEAAIEEKLKENAKQKPKE